MQKEIFVAIIASVATFIVAIINVIYSKGIAAKQNEIELKKTRIEFLENRRFAIERVNADLKKIHLDIKPDELMDLSKSGPKMIDHFRKRSDLFHSIGHFFKDEIHKELSRLNNDINNSIVKTAQNIAVTNDEAKIIVDRMSKMNLDIDSEISYKLREIESKIQNLLN